MILRRAFLSLAATVLLSCVSVARDDERLEKFVFEKAEMGVPFRITLYAADEDAAR